MKPTANTLEVESTLTGEEVTMTIDPGAMAHIMSVLTNLYSDPQLAVLREYATNAFDAHVEAGAKAPVEVTLPTAIHPFLTITDHGIGMDAADIRRIYSQYGASTKRDTNKQTGMLGLGGKSALTYAAQFTVTGVKNGRRIAVAVSRSEDGGGAMTIVSDEATTEPNGVTISIPTQRVNQFAEKAANLFQYWPVGSVTVDGKVPGRFEGLLVNDNLWLVEDDSYSQRYRGSYYRRQYGDDDTSDHVCVMGNVPYPMKLGERVKVPYGTKLVAFVDIGEVHFTPSREALHYTTLTNKTLDKIADNYKTGIRTAVQREVDNAAEPSEALAVLSKWLNHLGGDISGFTYKGNSIPVAHEELDISGRARGIRVTDGNNGYRLGGYTEVLKLSSLDWPEYVWVEGFTPGDVSAQHKRKFNKWCEDNSIANVSRYVLLRGKAPVSDFIDRSRVVDYTDTILPIKLAVNVGTGRQSKLPGTYFCFTEDSKQTSGNYVRWESVELAGDDIRTDRTLLWVHGNKWRARGYCEAIAALCPKGWTLVCLQSNRIDKFKRIMAGAEQVDSFIQRKGKEYLDGLNDLERVSLWLGDNYLLSGYKVLDPTKIHDPDLTKAAEAARLDSGKHSRALSTYGVTIPKPQGWNDPIKKYPLFDERVARQKPDHVYTYLNAAYKETQA